jgi:signal transduction histidine kinase
MCAWRTGAAGALVHADPARLQQVVWNLVSNAVKFSPRGGCVEVTTTAVADAVVIVVRDQGIGITPEFLPHVFDRFRQADGSSTRAHAGIGLGLAIAKDLVEMHRGAIVAESPGRNRGATFTVRCRGSTRRPKTMPRPRRTNGTSAAALGAGGRRSPRHARDDGVDARR